MKRNPVIRMANLLAYFGWQGGTIHQIAKETGVDASTLLYGNPPEKNGAYISGQSALSTCSRDWRVNELARKRYGNVEYWLGVADCFPLPRLLWKGMHHDKLL